MFVKMKTQNKKLHHSLRKKIESINKRNNKHIIFMKILLRRKFVENIANIANICWILCPKIHS